MRPIFASIVVIISLLLPGLTYALSPSIRSSFSIRNESASSIDIRFELPEWNFETSNRSGLETKRVVINDAPYLFIGEEETLPIISTSIAIPNTGGVNLNIISNNSRIERNISLDEHSLISSYQVERGSSNTLYPEYYVQIGEPVIIRDLRIVTLNIYPFQYDQNRRELQISESIDIRLEYNNQPSVNEILSPTPISKSFDKIYQSLVLNYDSISRNRTSPDQLPVMLVIYGNFNNTTYLAKIAEYVALKKQKGYIVYTASTATAGTSTTAIKNYIQNAYNNWTDRPDYVVLIGDASGTIAVPAFSYSGGDTDYPYTHLSGGDLLGDVIIGRISVSSSDEFVTYIAKLTYMEKNIDTASADWLNKMLLVGDSAASGISTIYTNRYIRDLSEAVNPNYTYTELYQNSPSPAAMNTAMNQGVSIFNYRGYIGMSGWNTTYIGQLFNGAKLFHAVIITCSTGNYASGTGTTESVVRQGTAAGLGGAITAIGMSTSSTHTPMNNCLNVGIFHGIYPMEMRGMGAPLLLGKLYLNSVYGVSNPTQAAFFAHIGNLIGDPTVPVYVGIPNTFGVSYPTSIASGTPTMEIIVRDAQHNFVPNATVTLINSSTLHIIGSTDANGRVIFDIPTTLSGSVTMMVSKDDFKPTEAVITINSGGAMVYDGCLIDDDNTGNSSGNNNQIINSGETIEFKIKLKNTSSSTINFASGDLTTSDPYVTMISSRMGFASVASGAWIANTSPTRFIVSPNCPDNHEIIFNATGGSSAGVWSAVVPVTVRTGSLELQNYSFIGSTNNLIHPGDIYNMTCNVQNTGTETLSNVYGILRSYDPFFAVTDSLGFFGTITANSTVSNSINPFTIYARGQCINGMIVPLDLYLYNDNGYAETKSITITIGQTTLTDPLGQDAYGYFIFDDGDTAYLQAPVYNWIGIMPSEGGSGSALTLSDPGASGDEGDQVGAVSIQTINLPFSFKFYGVSYSQASISSNGFIAMGATQNSDWRNWRLPGPGGPNPMIAVFWDDLQINTGSGVYTYYNAAQHYYVVQWNVINGYDRTTPEQFQAILYDPVYYPTQTGDGQIKLQYKIFNNIDMGSGDSHPHGNYATIGIKDHNGLVGLEYSFNNQYPVAAKPLSHQSALLVTTKPFMSTNAHLFVEQTSIYDANENGFLEPGESANLSIRLGNMGLGAATGISATLSETDQYVTISNASVTYNNIESLGMSYANDYFVLNIASNCPDEHVINLQINISSSAGNWSYPISVVVHKPTVIMESWSIDDSSTGNNGRLDPGETAFLVLNIQNESTVDAHDVLVSLSESSAYLSLVLSQLSIDHIPAGRKYQKRLSVSATANCPVGTIIPIGVNITSANGEPSTGSFNLAVGLSNAFYNFEVNDGAFIATNNPSPGWEWGTSTYSGAYSGTKVWGTVLNGTYGDNATYELVSPTMQLGSSSQLTFRHRYNIENNYDGGQVLISTNNGSSWTIITPTGGYPHSNLPALGGPGYHGTLNTWTLATFELSTYAGSSARFKWLFKTDGSVTREGWFIDDVTVSNTSSSVATGRVSGTLMVNGQSSGNQDALINAGEYICRPNTDGSYLLNLPAGQYSLKAILSGYASNLSNATVVENTQLSGINPQLTYLPVPSNVSWLVVGSDLSLRWTAVNSPNFSAYRVYEKIGTQGWQLVETTNQNTLQRTLNTNTWYDYKVVALHTDDESLYERQVHISYLDMESDVQPAIPSEISLTQGLVTNTISWQPVTQDTLGNSLAIWEYRVFAGATPDFQINLQSYLGSTTNTSYTDSYNTAKRFYKVIAVVGFAQF